MNLPPNQIDFKNIQKTDYVGQLITFLEKYLPDFPNNAQKKPCSTHSEDEITVLLLAYLMLKCRFNLEMVEYPFWFARESPQPQPQGHNKRMDMTAHILTEDSDGSIIYCIEAKKLPTLGTGRQKEYVIGDGGGISRFKEKLHGMDGDATLLDKNGIVAYITKDDFEVWHQKINEWIAEAGWASRETLTKEYFKTIAKLSSIHARIAANDVEMTHFWVKIAK